MMRRICDNCAIQHSVLQSTTPFFTCIPLAKVRKHNSKAWETTCEVKHRHTLAGNYIPRYTVKRTSWTCEKKKHSHALKYICKKR